MTISRKIGILGDVHANLSALEACLSLLDLEEVTEIFQLGDLVGYGARPNEVLDLVRSRGIQAVAGNHDWALLGKIDIAYFNSYASAALEWTGKVITPENRAYLEDLPLRVDDPSFCLFHGTLPDPEAFNYLQSFPAARTSLNDFTAPIGFCGHTHVPMNFIQRPDRSDLEWHFKTEWLLDDGQRAVVNVGSVGQPRDENPLAAVAIYEIPGQRVRLLRTPYNIPAEQKLIRAAGLPNILGDRLIHGI